MAKNLILSVKTASDVDKRIERVLNGLGNPEPPLRLEDVRELLKLDVGFYTANDPSLADEFVSKIRVATIQVYKRPTLLLEAIRKLSLKALYLPDRKRILLDSNLPLLKHRWNEAHEVGHSLLPWHKELMHGDNDHTLSKSCEEQIEAEANFAAGRLLFLRDRFTEEALSFEPTFENVKYLHKRFGNTLSTTLYRFVESIGDEKPVLGVISCHPHRPKTDFDPSKPTRYFIQSPAFKAQFGKVTEVNVFAKMQEYCLNRSGGTIGHAELIIQDDNGDAHRFYFETFYNTHDALTLGVYLGPEPVMVAMSTTKAAKRAKTSA